MATERHDDSFEAYLKGKSRVSRAYRGTPRAEPAAATDARILAQARDAVGKDRRGVHGPFGSHWLLPASLAAVIVISIGLFVYMGEESGVTPGAPGASRPIESAPTGREERERALSAPAESTGSAKERRAEPGAPSPAAREMRKAAPSHAPSPQADAVSPAVPKKESAASPPAPPAGMTVREEPALGSSQETKSPGRAAEEQARPPQEWLADIERLRKQGRDAEAEALLAEFRRRFPDYPTGAIDGR